MKNFLERNIKLLVFMALLSGGLSCFWGFRGLGASLLFLAIFNVPLKERGYLYYDAE